MPDWARPVVRWEIAGRDPGRLRQFYAELFNWKIEDGALPGIATIEPGVGGPEPGPGGHIMAAEAPRVALFVQVADLQASLRRAEELGGTVLQQPFDVPGGPTVARIADPEGNHIGLVQQ